jgi:hypothetical protein
MPNATEQKQHLRTETAETFFKHQMTQTAREWDMAIARRRASERECISNLGLGDDLDGDVLALVLALLGPGAAGVAEMAAADLLAELILGEEVFREAEALVQSEFRLAAFGDGRLIGLHRAVPPRQERADVLRRRRRWEGPLEPVARRRRRHARVSRRALVARRRERARQVERELGLLRCARLRRRRRRRRGGAVLSTRGVAGAGGYMGILHRFGLRDLRRLAMAETHWDPSPPRA